MALAVGLAIQYLSGTTWTDITADGLMVEGLSIRYGLAGNRPTDVLARTGECRFALKNTSNSGGVDGYYSPLHTNARSGWGHDTRLRVAFWVGETFEVTSITVSGTTATASASFAPGHVAGAWVRISGAGEAVFNNIWLITGSDASSFTFTVPAGYPINAGGSPRSILAYPQFLGTIDTIDPVPGTRRSRRVYVTAYDDMQHIHDLDIRDVALQSNTDEATIINAVLNALPSEAQPTARYIDAGLDVIPYALDDLGDGVRASAVLRDLLVSSYGLGYVLGDGMFVYRNRNVRAAIASAATFSNSMHEMVAPSTRSNVFTKVRARISPATVDVSDVVLASLAGTPIINASATETFDLAFRDPDDATRTIGAASTVSLASGTDYTANTKPDGTGTNVTASLSVVVSVKASRALFTVENTSGSPLYLTKLQIRGKGLYRDAPRIVEHGTGDLILNIDLPYTADDGAASQIGSLIVLQHGSLDAQIDSLTLKCVTEANILQAIGRRITDIITVTESMTGLAAVEAEIRSVGLRVDAAGVLTVEWGLGPVIPGSVPNAPSSLTATVLSDSQVDLDWTTGSGAGSAVTNIYRNGAFYAQANAGDTGYTTFGLARATDYTFTVRHVLNALVSDASNSANARPRVIASGGTESSSGGYKYHRFTSSGTFTITADGTIDDILVVSGGGGGGDSDSALVGGGGGGAGGVIHLQMNNESGGAKTIVIGAGGSGSGGGTAGGNGSASSYNVSTAPVAGGGGGSYLSGANNGATGGSGGGGSGSGGTGGAGTSLQGNAGGDGAGTGAGSRPGGGGGGKGSVGGNATISTTPGGAAGSGYSSFDGTFAVGGLGGGVGDEGNGQAGTANTGNGGNGNDNSAGGGNGGSGYVVIRYLE